MKKVLLILLLLGLFIGVVSCKKDEPKPVDPDPVDPVDPDPVDPDPIDPEPVDVTLTISDKEIILEEDEEKTITITVTEGYEYLVSIDKEYGICMEHTVEASAFSEEGQTGGKAGFRVTDLSFGSSACVPSLIGKN